MESTKGASQNERLLDAARQDNEEQMLDILGKPGNLDINHQDGLGNTALHYAAKYGSTDVLEHLLEYDGCDVDLQNRLDRATPLHLAVELEDPKIRLYVIGSLLDAGADTTIKNKYGQSPAEIMEGDAEMRALLRKSKAKEAMSREEVADDSDGEPGSGSDDG